MKKKKIGIVADNYKLDKFKEELTSKGFIEIEITPFTLETSLLTVNTEERNTGKIKTICDFVEAHFKRKN